jgi:urease accessory protein
MKKILSGIFIVFLFPDLLYGHIPLPSDEGFLSGLFHPVLGFDHFLAMLSVGILSAQMGGRAIWKVPLTFVLVMAVGASIGINSIKIPAVEFGIALSVLLLGISLVIKKKLIPIWVMICVAFFAIFHGHAHGTEMPKLVKPVVYAIGFILGTAAIHVLGVLIGIISSHTAKGAEFLRFVGAGISGIGAYILYLLIIKF